MLTQRTQRTERDSRCKKVRRSEGGGRADGLHWPIERFGFEWLSDSIGASGMMRPTEAASPRPPSWAIGHTEFSAGVLGETALPGF